VVCSHCTEQRRRARLCREPHAAAHAVPGVPYAPNDIGLVGTEGNGAVGKYTVLPFTGTRGVLERYSSGVTCCAIWSMRMIARSFRFVTCRTATLHDCTFSCCMLHVARCMLHACACTQICKLRCSATQPTGLNTADRYVPKQCASVRVSKRAPGSRSRSRSVQRLSATRAMRAVHSRLHGAV
jgi:hypothetical protein